MTNLFDSFWQTVNDVLPTIVGNIIIYGLPIAFFSVLAAATIASNGWALIAVVVTTAYLGLVGATFMALLFTMDKCFPSMFEINEVKKTDAYR